MAACEYSVLGTASLSVNEWRTTMGLPTDCDLTPAQAEDVAAAIHQADEDVALYAGWWPTARQVCEEIPVAVQYGGCFFARAGLSRWVTLRFGKVQAVEAVEFLRRPGSCTEGDACYSAEPGAVCLTDSRYGSVELDVRSAAGCRWPNQIERVRIRYVSGDVGTGQPVRFRGLLARYAATLLCSPYLCGVDLRCDDWSSYTLTDTEYERSEETIYGSQMNLDDYTETERWQTNTREQRLPQNPNDYQSPFGHTQAGVQLWRYLKSRRRLRAYRL